METKRVAYDIDCIWDEREVATELLDTQSKSQVYFNIINAASDEHITAVKESEFESKSKDECIDILVDIFHHNPQIMRKILTIPTFIEIPSYEYEYGDIQNFLEMEIGLFVNSFKVGVLHITDNSYEVIEDEDYIEGFIAYDFKVLYNVADEAENIFYNEAPVDIMKCFDLPQEYLEFSKGCAIDAIIEAYDTHKDEFENLRGIDEIPESIVVPKGLRLKEVSDYIANAIGWPVSDFKITKMHNTRD